MISVQVVEKLDSFESLFGPGNQFGDLNDSLSLLWEASGLLMEAVSNTAVQDGVIAFSKELRTNPKYEEALGKMRSVRPSKLLKLMADLSETLDNYFPAVTSRNWFLEKHRTISASRLHDMVDTIIVSYENYLQTHSMRDFLILCNEGARLYEALRNSRALLTVVRNWLYTPDEETIEENRLSILLESTPSINGLATKLSAIEQLYFEIANLLDINPNTYPLKINKVETGSFWADLKGNKKITSLMETLIGDTVSYFYRSFTNEGKITALPRKVEAIEEILQLREKLKEAGLVNDELDEHLQKSAVLISKNLNQLLLGEVKVVVNQSEYSLKAELEQKYLVESRKLFLPQPPLDTISKTEPDDSNNFGGLLED